MSSTSQRLIGKKDSEKKCLFSVAGSLDLDEDDAKASYMYNNRVVAISLGPWFKFYFFARHSFLASGMPFPIVSRIVVNVSVPSEFG